MTVRMTLSEVARMVPTGNRAQRRSVARRSVKAVNAQRRGPK